MARKKQGRLIDISIVGDKAARKKFRRLSDKIQKKMVRDTSKATMKKVVQPVVNANIAKVSPGETPHKDAGRLRAAGTTVGARTGSRQVIGAVVKTPTRTKLKIPPDDAYYPAVLEYGSTARNIEPQSMLRKAKNQTNARAIQHFAAGMARAISRFSTKLGAQKT